MNANRIYSETHFCSRECFDELGFFLVEFVTVEVTVCRREKITFVSLVWL